jgi:cation diffusion facilitator family transporter
MDAGERLALASVAINVLVAGLKFFLGVFSGSLALLADAVHSSADVVSSASIWAGIRISRRKTKMYPFGLYKVENLVALLTAAIIFLAGYEIVHTVVMVQRTGQGRSTGLRHRCRDNHCLDPFEFFTV